MRKPKKGRISIKAQHDPLSSMKRNLGITLGIIFSVILVVTILGLNFGLNETSRPPTVSPTLLSGYQATLYTTPDCSCCHQYAAYLTDYSDVDLKIVKMNYSELLEIKDAQGIQPQQRACHTVLFEGFFVEGHVNLEAIEAFVTGGHVGNARGLILPGMPPGSPGMGGIKTGYTVLLMTNSGETIDFMSF